MTLHASAVAWQGRAALILGPSGSGKSALALNLMALGAVLVADDRVRVSVEGSRLIAASPEAIRGRIEARGIGILNAEAIDRAELALVVDLSATETERLPPWREFRLFERVLPLVHRVESGHFPAAILQYLKAGRNA
ncbi:MAG: HPr kinase/phosphatase C-terminal domain-containing protein [Rhodobacteraceae bacterium]|nr:HPr kinase/phosphatase C-terminal domain-containing protein [Paracoccaceae bacterium]